MEQYFTVELFVFNFTQFVILENLSILDLALLGVKGLKRLKSFIFLFVASMETDPSQSHAGKKIMSLRTRLNIH